MDWFRKSSERLLARGVGYAMKGQALHFYDRGMGYARHAQHDRAIADFDEAIKLNPHRADYFWWRGHVYAAKGQYDRAIADYDEAIRLDPKDVVNFHSRGLAYRHNGQFDRAIADFDELLRLDPQNASNFWLRGGAYSAKGENERAVADYSMAQRLFHIGLKFPGGGLGHWEQDQYERAITDYDDAIKLDPKEASFFALRGRAYNATKEYYSAIADYDEAIKLNPKNAGFFTARGDAYRWKGQSVLRREASLNGGKIPTSEGGFMYTGDFKRAVTDFDKAIRLDPWAVDYRAETVARKNQLCGMTPAQTLNASGWEYYAKGRYDRAIADFDEAIRLDPKAAFIFANRGNAYAGKGLCDRAIADYDEAIRLD